MLAPSVKNLYPELRTKIEEKLRNDIKCEESLAREEVVCEADGDKYSREDDEAHDLDRFAA